MVNLTFKNLKTISIYRLNVLSDNFFKFLNRHNFIKECSFNCKIFLTFNDFTDFIIKIPDFQDITIYKGYESIFKFTFPDKIKLIKIFNTTKYTMNLPTFFDLNVLNPTYINFPSKEINFGRKSVVIKFIIYLLHYRKFPQEIIKRFTQSWLNHDIMYNFWVKLRTKSDISPQNLT